MISQFFRVRIIEFSAKVYLANPHSPFEGWFTLFTLPFTLFEGWITLLEGWMSFWKEDSPFKKGERIHPWGWITLLEVWITLKKGESPFWRVNRQVRVEKGWMKGESPFSRVNEKRVNRIRVNEGWITLLKGEWKRYIDYNERILLGVYFDFSLIKNI